jgi:uncharacterized protein YjiS (DUF1127 family)
MSSVSPALGVHRTLRIRPRRPSLIAWLVLWRRRHRTRRQLRELDRCGLDDVGIDASAQRREVAKWFWQS